MLRPILFSLLILGTLNAQDPLARRVAFDIGSGQIKMQVSDVDTAIGKIALVLLTDSAKVALREDLIKNGRFSPEIENKLIDAIRELIKKSEPFHPEAFHAIATESFRLATNAKELVSRIKIETGLDVTIISQEEEGILGFISAIQAANVDPEKVVSLDIGGGSFQLTTRHDHQFYVYQGKLGKIPFRNALLQIEGFEQALQFIQENLKDVPIEMIQKLRMPETVVLGIGIHPLWGIKTPECYDLGQLLQEIDRNNSDISILAYGIMKALAIQKVEYVGTQGANAIGTLLTAKYWE